MILYWVVVECSPGLHKQGRQIRQEESGMASQNKSHITKQKQKALNQQENAVSKEIGK